MTVNLKQQSHELAVSLNNTGLSLLERNALSEANRSFRDAIHLMKHCFRAVQGNPEHHAFYDITIDRAKRRVALAGLPLVSNDNKETTLMTDTTFGYNITFIHGYKMYHLDGNRDADLDSAMILHNFAVAHLILAVHDSLADSDTILSVAMQVFQLAYQVVHNKLALWHADDRFEAGLDIMVAILSCMVALYRGSGQDELALGLSVELHDAERQLMSYNILEAKFTAAAAA